MMALLCPRNATSALAAVALACLLATSSAIVTRSDSGSCSALSAELFYGASSAATSGNSFSTVAPLLDDAFGFGQKSFTPDGVDIQLVAADPVDACSTLVEGSGGVYTGRYVLASRGSCSFFAKALQAANAGAVGIVIYNNVNGDPISNMVMPTGSDAPSEADQITVQNMAVYGLEEADYQTMVTSVTLSAGNLISGLVINFQCEATTTTTLTNLNLANKSAVQNQWDTFVDSGVFDTYNPVTYRIADCHEPIVSGYTCITAPEGCTEGYYCPYGNLPIDVIAPDLWEIIQCNTSAPDYDVYKCCSVNVSTGFIECKCPLGFYCPINTSQPLYCFGKYYCDIPARIRRCPEGHYCPNATVEPIECNPLDICKESSQEPTRILLLVVLLVFFVALHFAFRSYHDYMEHHNRRADKDIADYHREREHRLTVLQNQVHMKVLPEDYARRHQSHHYDVSGNDINDPGKPGTKIVDPETGKEIGSRRATVLHIESVPGSMSPPTVPIMKVDEPTEHTSNLDTAGNGEHEHAPLIEEQYHKYDIEFRDIGLTLPNGVTIMEGVTGKFLSGRCCAIMGPSGAGKTTIISLVTGKYTKTHGQIFMNGHEVSGLRAWKKEVGFVPQDDIMHRELSVRQNIEFSARLRLPSDWTEDEIRDHVDWIIETLDIAHVQNSIVGDDKKRGISGGQRKRVNIALELAGFPSVLFLDEPTSGLDSTTATELCVTLRKLAENHHLTIVSVIHSPTPKAFAQFHDLLLLQKGGRTAYYGELEAAASLMQVFRYDPMAPDESPADYLLNVVSGRVHRHPTEKELEIAEGHEEVTAADLYLAWRDHVAVHGHADLHKIEGLDGHRKHRRNLGVMGLRTHFDHAHEQSKHTFGTRVANYVRSTHAYFHHAVSHKMNRTFGNFEHDAEKKMAKRRTMGYFGQYFLCTARAFRQKLSDTSSFTLSLGIHLGLGFAMAIALSGESYVGPYPSLFCYYASAPALIPKCVLPLVEIYAVSGMLLAFAISFASVSVSVATFGDEQVIYFRECQAGLRTIPYFFGKLTVDMLVLLIDASLFTAGFALMYSAPAEWGPLFGLIVLLYLFGWAIGFFLSSMVSSSSAPIAGVGVAVLWCVLFGGFQPSLKDVEQSYDELSFLWDISGPRWGIEAYVLNNLKYYETSPLNPSEPYINITTTIDGYGYDTDRYNKDFLFLGIICISWLAIALFTMMATNHTKKE